MSYDADAQAMGFRSPEELADYQRRLAAAPTAPAIRYDALHEYAAQHRLDYNELCRVVRCAAGVQEMPSGPVPALDKPAIALMMVATFKFLGSVEPARDVGEWALAVLETVDQDEPDEKVAPRVHEAMRALVRLADGGGR